MNGLPIAESLKVKSGSEPLPPLRIALSIWMFQPGTGGLQSHAEHLARHLIARGHEVTVITRSYTFLPEGMGFLHDREPDSRGVVGGIPVRTFSYCRCFRPLHFLIAHLKDRPGLRTIARILYQFQAIWGNQNLYTGYDIIHHVGQATALVGFAAAGGAKRNGVPFVVQPTCHPYQIGDAPLDLALYRKARRALVHTHYEADHLAPFLRDMDIDVVGNGIENRTDGNADRFRQKHKIEGPLVLYIGRREQDKGYPLVVDAFRHIREERPEVTLVCMGPPGGIPKREVPGSIHFDYVDEQTKHDALSACTCLCVPSEGESFGLVYMEAGRYEKPVIARNLPVMQELLRKGEAGLLIGTLNHRDNSNQVSAEEVASAICSLLDSPDLCKMLGKACREVSDEFIWETIATRFETSYWRAITND